VEHVSSGLASRGIHASIGRGFVAAVHWRIFRGKTINPQRDLRPKAYAAGNVRILPAGQLDE
jgi:hypothetical protein